MSGQHSQNSMASLTALKSAKKELRIIMKQKLATISQDSISAQSAAVFQSLQGFRPYQESNRIGIYLSMPTGEIQTDSIVRHALEVGKQVFVPYLYKPQGPLPDIPKSVMDMVKIQNLSDYESLKRDSWGIPTIAKDTVREREHILAKAGQGLDLILMPGVAFDTEPETQYVRRLGHGRGFYDYFLQRYRESLGSKDVEPAKTPGNYVLLYGLALNQQLLDQENGLSVPVGKHDSLIHGVLVGNGEIIKGPVLHE